jgi:hypothetical protein
MKKNFYLKILGLFSLLFLLEGCSETASNYNEWQNLYSNSHKYLALACPAATPDPDKEGCGMSASNESQYKANQTAIDTCSQKYSDCAVIKEGSRIVYSQQDANRVQMATLIEDAKNTCKSLGFQERTDKFTDCTLKLYSQKLDLAEKQNQQVVVQNQGSSTVRVIDVTRERETTMRRSMGLINGTCTLATYYSC